MQQSIRVASFLFLLTAAAGCQERYDLHFQWTDKKDRELRLEENQIKLFVEGAFSRSVWNDSIKGFVVHIQFAVENHSSKAFMIRLNEITMSSPLLRSINFHAMYQGSSKNRTEILVGQNEETFNIELDVTTKSDSATYPLSKDLLFMDLTFPWLSKPLRVWFDDEKFIERIALEDKVKQNN